MRTTITLDDDVAALLEKYRAAHRVSFRVAVNTVLRDRLVGPAPVPFRTRTASLGARVNLDKASQLLAQMDDEEFVRKMTSGK